MEDTNQEIKKVTMLDDLKTPPTYNLSNDKVECTYDLVSVKRVDTIDDGILNYFTQLMQNEQRAKSIVKKLIIELTDIEIKQLSKHLKAAKIETITPAKFDLVTAEVVLKLKDFVLLVKSRDLEKIKYLKEINKEIFQELREAFITGKILKNKLKDYFFVLHVVNLSAKTIMAQLRIIEPVVFANKKGVFKILCQLDIIRI